MITEDDVPLQETHFRQLKWSLQGLAALASDQLALFPGSVARADELALDFDQGASVVREHYQHDLSPAQAGVLESLCRKLSTMSRDGADFDVDIWTDAALASSEHWAQVRSLAAAALDAFGWSVEHPPAR